VFCAIFFMLFSITVITPQPALANWVSYTNSGFVSPAILMSKSNNNIACPGPNCQQTFNATDVVVCPNVYVSGVPLEFSLIRRIMPCVKDTLLAATNRFLAGSFLNYMGNVASAAGTLAIVLLGVMMIGGRSTAVWKDAMVLGLKLGAVVFLMNHLNYDYQDPGRIALFPAALDIMDSMVYSVTSYALWGSHFGFYSFCQSLMPTQDLGTPNVIWNYMDCTLEMVLGGILNFSSGATIPDGMMGFLFASLVSKGMGITIGLVGIYLLVQLIFAIVRCMYMYVAAYLGVALCVIVSPLFIPMILFRATRDRFASWLRTLIGFMIQPVIIAAYLGMLLTAFDVLVFTGPNSLTRAIAGTAVDCPVRVNVGNNVYTDDFMFRGGLGAWMNGYNLPGCSAQKSYTEKSIMPTAVVLDAKTAISTPGDPTYVPPVAVVDNGLPGSQVTSAPIDTVNTTFMNKLGITNSGGKSTFMGMSVDIEAVDWDKLRANAFNDRLQKQNGGFIYGNHYRDPNYDPANFGGDQDKATSNYLLDVLRSAIMAFLVGYIFLKILDALPFLGATMAMGNSVVQGMESKTLGSGSLSPPGSNAVKSMKPAGGG
jgi:hypothetical protein